MGVLEYRPNKEFHSQLDLFYSKFDDEVIHRGLEAEPQRGLRCGDEPLRPWLLLPWITLPFGIYLTSKVLSLNGRDLNPILKKSGQLLLVYGVLLAIGASMSAR